MRLIAALALLVCVSFAVMRGLEALSRRLAPDSLAAVVVTIVGGLARGFFWLVVIPVSVGIAVAVPSLPVVGLVMMLATFVMSCIFLVAESNRKAAKPNSSDAPRAGLRSHPRFEIVRIVGRGATSEVWEALDRERDRRRVALKRRPFLATPMGRRAQALFMEEAKTGARLRHPNIVPLLDVVFVDEEPWLVFEFVEGETLTQLILRTGPMSPADTARIASPVCRALAYSHANGFVHRDVKPSNIMIAVSGEVKVADFGAARALQYEFESTRRVSGSPAYMSPELKRGVVSRQADIYALGVCCLEMLQGRVPEDPPRVGALADSLPGPFAAAVARALDPDPVRRQPTVEEFEAALESVKT